jgi:TIR domain
VPRKPKKPPAPPYRVFLSHATADKFVARCMLEKIEAVGATAFIDDRDIEGGADIPEAIVQEMKAAQELVVLLTPKSVSREWVLIELGMARMQGIRIVPPLYQSDPAQMPEMLRLRKGYDLNDFDKYLEELKGRVTR